MGELARDGQSQGVGGQACSAKPVPKRKPVPEPYDARPEAPGRDRRIAQAAPESAVLARLTLLQLTAGNAAAARLLTAPESPADAAP